jgi:tRNA (guanine-N7-)-methyltransferase
MNPEEPTALVSSLVYELPSIVERLDLAKLFPQHQPLQVELGCGDASFLAEYARRHPDKNFIGVERLLGRIRKLDKKGRRLRLMNLRGVRIENAYFIEWLLPGRAAEALHVYFPDPWPKLRHRRHRLINDRFPDLAHAALQRGGCIFLRTDDADYFEQMQTVFAASPKFLAAETPAELGAILTDFEIEFAAKGIPTRHAAYEAR